MNPNFWDQRYNVPELIYGREPNVFFKEELLKLVPGSLFLPGEGEGRNALYACSLGWDVLACDWSREARRKALEYAEKSGCSYKYDTSDLCEYSPGGERFDVVASIFVHFALSEREQFQRMLVDSLKPGGTLIFLAYSKEQLGKSSGGPQELDLLYSLEEVCESFIDFDFITLSRETVSLQEGPFHQGDASVIKFVGKKSEGRF